MFAPVPVTAAGVFMVWRFLPSPESRPKPYPLDVLGLVLLGATIGLSLDSLNRLQNVVGQGDHQNGMPTVEAFQFAWWMVAVFLALAIIPVWKMRT